MGSWFKLDPVRATAVFVYVLLAVLPLLPLLSLSPEGSFLGPMRLGFTLYIFLILMTKLWEPFFLAYIYAPFWLPVFYFAVAFGLEKRNRISWILALASTLLTITANSVWIRIGNGMNPGAYGAEAGLVFNIIALIILFVYWYMIVRSDSILEKYGESA